MSTRRSRRGNEDTNISFLDIICCGFGAIVLLLVIVRPTEPVVIEESLIKEDGIVRALQERLFEIRGQVQYLETDLNAKQEQLGKDTRRVAILRSEFDLLNSRRTAIEDNGAEDATQALDLQVALQTLTREMRALLKGRVAKNDYIGGVPVDSEYIVFIIDSSGSMTQNAWGRLRREVRNTLAIHPRVKGIQVMNTDGQLMFPTLRGQYMKDSPSRRREILRRLATWNAFAQSNPVPGITAAFRQFYDKKKKISLYVFGDDFQGRSVRRVLDLIGDLNKSNRAGDTLVRIHTVGFPVQLLREPSLNSSGVRFATLMRELAEQNNGTFIGLNDVR